MSEREEIERDRDKKEYSEGGNINHWKSIFKVRVFHFKKILKPVQVRQASPHVVQCFNINSKHPELHSFRNIIVYKIIYINREI